MLEHMAWANQEIYKEIKKLDTKVLDYFVIDPEWTVRTIMIHIAGASHLYGQRLNGEPFSRFELKTCLLYTSPSPRDATLSRMPSSA